MAKRRQNKKQPNLPQATLDRARREAGVEPEATSTDEAPVQAVAPTKETTSANAAAKQRSVERAARRNRLTPVQLEQSRKKGELSAEVIRELLKNPTEHVTEEQLHADYGHVIADLRNMALLAAVLLVALVALAQFI